MLSAKYLLFLGLSMDKTKGVLFNQKNSNKKNQVRNSTGSTVIQMSNNPCFRVFGWFSTCLLHGDDRGYEFIIAGAFQNLDAVSGSVFEAVGDRKTSGKKFFFSRGACFSFLGSADFSLLTISYERIYGGIRGLFCCAFAFTLYRLRNYL